MEAQDVLKSEMESAKMVLGMFLEDLSTDDLYERPVPSANHIAWQLGHLIVSNDAMLNAIKPGVAPALPEGFAERYTKEKASSDETTDLHDKDTYLKLFFGQCDAVGALLGDLSKTDLEKPGPESMRSYAPTNAALFSMMSAHAMMHAGQFSVVRRKLGKPYVM